MQNLLTLAFCWSSMSCVYIAHGCQTINCASEQEIKQWLEAYNKEALMQSHDYVLKTWNHQTNLTEYNFKALQKATVRYSEFIKHSAEKANMLKLSNATDAKTVRLLKKIGLVGVKLDPTDAENFTRLKDQLFTNYAARNFENGLETQKIYEKLVNLSNVGAKNDGFADLGACWRCLYEVENVENNVENLWRKLLPLYEHLHTYIRGQLKKQNTKQVKTATIPVHLLDKVVGPYWNNVPKFILPFSSEPSIDVTENMVQLGYSPLKMFKLADNFFKSLGMMEAPPKFWNNSIFQKPGDQKINCHPFAYNFYAEKDVRVQMCASINMKDLVRAHHEMGHIQYFLQYAKQPVIFQRGAHPGFHEAVGDAISLSVTAPQYLKTVGLLPDYETNERQEINYLFQQALSKLAFLPFAYLVDLWRWKVFAGAIQFNEWNNKWWELREKFQGIKPTTLRSNKYFDPMNNMHIVTHTPFIQYFFSVIMQFQFYESLCSAAGHEGILHQCNFFNNTAAGAKLAKMLQLGSSVPWPIALQQLTKQKTVSVEPIIEYFKPLINWLEKANKGECFGWGYRWPKNYNLSMPRCP